MLWLRPPGVYRPQADTWLLADAITAAALPSGASVLDIGTGTGVLAAAAVRAGAGEVTAIDVSPRAVLAARCNTALRRLPVHVYRGDGMARVAGQRFDVILANPPYVPGERLAPERQRGASRNWNGGPDGRVLLDPLCGGAAGLLRPGGMLLLVQSEMSGTDATLAMLRDGGLKASVVARRDIPFGPVLRSRLPQLRACGLVAPGQRTEELVVIRGDRCGR